MLPKNLAPKKDREDSHLYDYGLSAHVNTETGGSPVDIIKKKSRIVTAAIFFSRVLGLVREQVFAFFFGAGAAQDAFVAAFRVPGLLRDLLAEGTLSQSFVAVFAQRSADGDKNTFALANKFLILITITLGVIVVTGVIFSPLVIKSVAAGFDGDKFAAAVSLNRILFPITLLVAFAALFMGLLNAKGYFFLPQSATTFFNLTSIVVGIATAYAFAPNYMRHVWHGFNNGGDGHFSSRDAYTAMTGMAVGTLVGGIVQWLAQAPPLFRLGFRFRPDLDFRDSDFLRVLRMSLPAILGGATLHINIMIGTYFASGINDGAVSHLNYAFRLMQFPIGIFGVAIATAAAPQLAKLTGDGDFKETLRSTLRMSLFLSLPSAVGLIVLAKPIIRLIYQHGHFTGADTTETSLALAAYATGIAGYALAKIYQPAFLARHDARTPMRIAFFSIALNIFLSWLFTMVWHLPSWGLALSTAISTSCGSVFLCAAFRGKVHSVWHTQQCIAVLKILIASLVMGIAAWNALELVGATFDASNFLSRFFAVLIPIGVGVTVYFIMTHILGIETVAPNGAKKIN